MNIKDQVDKDYVINDYHPLNDAFIVSHFNRLKGYSQVHGQPDAWLVGQILSFLMDHNESFFRLLDRFKRSINFDPDLLDQPFVG